MMTVEDLKAPLFCAGKAITFNTEGRGGERDEAVVGKSVDLFFSDEYQEMYRRFLNDYVMCMLGLHDVKKYMIQGKFNHEHMYSI